VVRHYTSDDVLLASRSRIVPVTTGGTREIPANGYNVDFPAWLKILHLGTVISTPIFFLAKGADYITSAQYIQYVPIYKGP
jgi:hypothetical protein